MKSMDERAAIERLLDLERRGGTSEDALAFFDALATFEPEAIWGLWRGSELRTGHPMEGLLERYGWYGKEFVDAETVHPLVFQDAKGALFKVDPRKVPMDLAEHMPRIGRGLVRHALSALEPVMGTTKPRARIRKVEHRGKSSATMIYDHLPIQDVFRRVDADTLLGLMDRRDEARPYFFVLRRVRAR